MSNLASKKVVFRGALKYKFTRILGISLILFSWILWGVILILPFFKLTLTQYAIVYPVIFAATNIFWFGAVLVGKEMVQKYSLWPKVKLWFKKCNIKDGKIL